MNKRPRLGAAVLVEHEGKYLLARRNKKNAFGKWIIPGGGVDWGETIEDAALREIKEETNLDVTLSKFISYEEIIYTPADYHAVVFFYLAKAKHLDIKVDDDISDAQFFTMEEIKELDCVDSVHTVMEKVGHQ